MKDKKAAIFDLLILFVVFWMVWSFRFLEIGNSGLYTVLISAIVAILLLRFRKINPTYIGMVKPDNTKKLMQGIFSVMFLTFITQALGIGIAGALNALPTESSAIANQPDSMPAFLFDIVISTWIITALGEELLFRGFILQRLSTVLPGKHFLLASLLQGIWFGAGHFSQGVSGMLITGVIGIVLAQYYLRNKKAGLLPLIISHAVVDTVVLSINYFSG